jgi:hypothetical protein
MSCHVKPGLMLLVPFTILLEEASSEEKYLKMTPTGLISWIGWERCF